MLATQKTKETIEDLDNGLECAKLLQRIDDEEGNRTCTEQISDIEKIEKACGEYLAQEQKDTLAFAKANCQEG